LLDNPSFERGNPDLTQAHLVNDHFALMNRAHALALTAEQGPAQIIVVVRVQERLARRAGRQHLFGMRIPLPRPLPVRLEHHRVVITDKSLDAAG
jgi:hypothetical protein